jgi:hypothetical protein
VTNSYAAALLVFLGLFLVGGAVSLARQGLPKAVVGAFGLCAALALAAGILRWK